MGGVLAGGGIGGGFRRIGGVFGEQEILRGVSLEVGITALVCFTPLGGKWTGIGGTA